MLSAVKAQCICLTSCFRVRNITNIKCWLNAHATCPCNLALVEEGGRPSSPPRQLPSSPPPRQLSAASRPEQNFERLRYGSKPKHIASSTASRCIKCDHAVDPPALMHQPSKAATKMEELSNCSRTNACFALQEILQGKPLHMAPHPKQHLPVPCPAIGRGQMKMTYREINGTAGRFELRTIKNCSWSSRFCLAEQRIAVDVNCQGSKAELKFKFLHIRRALWPW